MRYASIDIGTNTILMLIAEIGPDLSVRPVKEFYSVPRLGKNVSSTRRLDPHSIGRAMRVLGEYKVVTEKFGVDRIVASATSAVRDAVNRKEFLSGVKEAYGINVEVIEGELEAKLGFLGAVSDHPGQSGSSLVIDIGGGSTELSFGTGSVPERFASVNVGAVRVTELFFSQNPPRPDELAAAEDFVGRGLSTFPLSQLNPDRVFAVAGTATTLALIAQNKYEFDPSSVNNYRMSVSRLGDVFGLLKSMTPEAIKTLTNAAEGREDVLLAGALILIKALEAAGNSEFITTDRGLRYGYLLYKHAGMSGK